MSWSFSELKAHIYGCYGNGPLLRVLEIRKLRPQGKFSEAAASTPFDYSKIDSWSAHPDRKQGDRSLEDANHLFLPDDEAASVPVEKRPADCFFVHDSTLTIAELFSFHDSGGDCRSLWNMPSSAPAGSATAQLVEKVNECVDLRVAAGASCFNRSCRIYAPRYRQANVLAVVAQVRLLGGPKEAKQSIELAYRDVRRAFIHFVDDPANAGRPFFVAGHSQGTMLLSRLLAEEVENHPSRLRRFVHGYIPGFAIQTGIFGDGLSNITHSLWPSDIRTMSSWRTLGPSHVDFTGLFKVRRSVEAGLSMTRHGTTLSVNPITWSSDRGGALSHPVLHRGAVFPLHISDAQSANILHPRSYVGGSGTHLRYGQLTMRVPGALGLRVPQLSRVECGPISARLDERGGLRLAENFPAGSLFELCRGDFLFFHDLDFCLFYGNVRDNAALRLQAWQEEHERSKL